MAGGLFGAVLASLRPSLWLGVDTRGARRTVGLD